MTPDTASVGLLDLGESQTAEDLLPMVYNELRQLAAARLRREIPGQTLQTTALVHETYLRLIRSGGENLRWRSRGQFFAAASEAMRRIIVENYRRKRCTKRGGNFDRTEIEIDSIAVAESPFDLLAINEALEALEAIDSKKALLVKRTLLCRNEHARSRQRSGNIDAYGRTSLALRKGLAGGLFAGSQLSTC